MNGELNIKDFINLYKKYTPNADLVLEYGVHCNSDINVIINDISWIRENL